MNTEFKTALNNFLKTPNIDIEKIVKGCVNKFYKNGYCQYEENIGWVNNNLFDMFIRMYANCMCSNIEIDIRKFDYDGNFKESKKICLYDIVNDVWDSIMGTEEYTEKELMDMPVEQYERIARETIINDVTDIICFAGD